MDIEKLKEDLDQIGELYELDLKSNYITIWYNSVTEEIKDNIDTIVLVNTSPEFTNIDSTLQYIDSTTKSLGFRYKARVK